MKKILFPLYKVMMIDSDTVSAINDEKALLQPLLQPSFIVINLVVFTNVYGPL